LITFQTIPSTLDKAGSSSPSWRCGTPALVTAIIETFYDYHKEAGEGKAAKNHETDFVPQTGQVDAEVREKPA
jgi:hypothetical protein